MKLYYSPGACSLSPHIALREANLPFELIQVDLKTKKTADGRDYYDINPKGSVPALEIAPGDLLTEGPAIVQYIGDTSGASIVPPQGSRARYRLMEALNFITSELHKGFSPLFSPDTPAEYKPIAKNNLKKKYGHIEDILGKSPYLLGEDFSVADGYLYNVTRWADYVGLDLSSFANLQAFMERMAARPAVQAALAAEAV